jgi:AraC-like DNA-binding protein
MEYVARAPANPACEVDWAAVAHWVGYHDQPHFNHELRRFTGLTPSEFSTSSTT